MNGNKINRIAATIDDLYSLYIPLDNEIKNIIKEFIKGNQNFNNNLALLDGNHNTEFVIPLLLYPFNKSEDYLNHVSGDWVKSQFIEKQLTNFFNSVAQKVSKGCRLKEIQNTIIKFLDTNTNVQVTLSDIFSCDDFINVFNGPESDIKNRLQDLLSKHTEMSYDDVKKAVDPSLLSSENKKIVFAKVLPEYNFKVCNEFNSTWDIFEKGYIDFDTLVTKFWARDDFDKNDQNSDQNEKNVFQNFASEYKNYTDYQNNDIGSLKSSATDMINGLNHKKIIDDNDIRNLQNQIDNATDVGVLGIIAQFFKNLFSKDKTAFKPIQQTKRDRVISNLKPLSGLLKQAADRHKGADDQLI